MSSVKTYASPTALLFGNDAHLAVTNWQAQWFVDGWLAHAATNLTHKNGAVYTEEVVSAEDGPVLLKPAPLPFKANMIAPVIMGVLNITPDSFSDGGKFASFDAATAHARKMLAEGAAILDIGGESTRPHSKPITVEEEQARVIPVIKAIAAEAKQANALISIDTRNASTMEAALKAGAHIINDVTALTHDPRAVKVAAEAAVPTILMHMQGTPETMQQNPTYVRVECDIYDYFEARIEALQEQGIKKSNLIVDPGIGFGKTPAHNAALIRRAALFHQLGVPVMLGTSRKSFIGALAGVDKAEDRLPGSLVAARISAGQGVQILRVHDVKESRQGIAFWQALQTVKP
jgi:dihydropteroate synthase